MNLLDLLRRGHVIANADKTAAIELSRRDMLKRLGYVGAATALLPAMPKVVGHAPVIAMSGEATRDVDWLNSSWTECVASGQMFEGRRMHWVRERDPRTGKFIARCDSYEDED